MIQQPMQQGAGLMGAPQNMQPQSSAAPPSPPIDPDVDQGQGVQVSESTRNPEEDMQIYLARGLDLMSSARTRDSMLVILGAKDPVRSLADALLIIMRKIDGSARRAGVETPDTVKVLGAHQLLLELSKIAAAAKIFSLDEAHLELAYATAIQDYIKEEIATGRIDGEKLAQKIHEGAANQPPEEKAKMQQSVQRLQDTAARYKGGGAK